MIIPKPKRLIQKHESIRGYFAYYLYKKMQNDSSIYLITADLGYKMFDYVKENFPERFINTGASEQAALDIAVGLALNGKIPVVYSITPFLVYRPFETIRTYINHESIPVKLIGSGIDKDYEHDGISHHAEDVKDFMEHFENIEKFYPQKKEEIEEIVDNLFDTNLNKPCFVVLRR